MLTIIETPRTVMRPFTDDDAETAFTWLNDPLVMRFYGGQADRTVDESRARVARYREHYARRGFGKFIVEEKETGSPIGDAGLQVIEEISPHPNLGFRLVPSRWGIGLASEIAAAWVAVGFDSLHMDTLSAFADVEHVASQRVLEKVGFTRTAREVLMGSDAFVFACHAPLRDGVDSLKAIKVG